MKATAGFSFSPRGSPMGPYAQHTPMADQPEPNFSHDVEEMQAAVTEALNALTDVKAYTLQADELHDYKAAQYALRNLCDEKGTHDVEAVYEDIDYGDRK